MRRFWSVTMFVSLVLSGCWSEAGPETPGVGKAGPNLRILRRTHPDAALMVEALEGRMAGCMGILRSRGVEAPQPPTPTPAEIARWVSNEEEELYANGQFATFHMTTTFGADPEKGCRWTAYRKVDASTEAVCGASFSGSAGAHPGVSASAESPEFHEEKNSHPEWTAHCLAEA